MHMWFIVLYSLQLYCQFKVDSGGVIIHIYYGCLGSVTQQKAKCVYKSWHVQ